MSLKSSLADCRPARPARRRRLERRGHHALGAEPVGEPGGGQRAQDRAALGDQQEGQRPVGGEAGAAHQLGQPGVEGGSGSSTRCSTTPPRRDRPERERARPPSRGRATDRETRTRRRERSQALVRPSAGAAPTSRKPNPERGCSGEPGQQSADVLTGFPCVVIRRADRRRSRRPVEVLLRWICSLTIAQQSGAGDDQPTGRETARRGTDCDGEPVGRDGSRTNAATGSRPGHDR
jgi:hypothetical protein